MPKYLCLDMRECTWCSGPQDFGGVICFEEEKEIEYYAVGVHRKLTIEAESARKAVEKIINEYECIAVHP